MNQVKIFKASDLSELETEINSFLIQNHGIEITDTKLTTVRINGKLELVTLVFYKIPPQSWETLLAALSNMKDGEVLEQEDLENVSN